MVGKCFIYIHFSKPSKFVIQCCLENAINLFSFPIAFWKGNLSWRLYFFRLPWYLGMSAKYFICFFICFSSIMSIKFYFSLFNMIRTETPWLAQFRSDQKMSEKKVILKLKNNTTLFSDILPSEQNWASSGMFVVFGLRDGEQT